LPFIPLPKIRLHISTLRSGWVDSLICAT